MLGFSDISNTVYDAVYEILRATLGATSGVIGFSLDIGAKGITAYVMVDSEFDNVVLPQLPGVVTTQERKIRPFSHPVAGGPPATTHGRLEVGSSLQARANLHGSPIVSKWGTIGAFVGVGTSTWLVTANHVISENGNFKDMRPANASEGVWIDKPQLVSKSVTFAPIKPAGNRADIAAAPLTEGVLPSPGQFYTPPLASGAPWTNPPVGTAVKMFSRAGTKGGKIQQLNYTGTVVESFTPTSPVYDGQFLLVGDAPGFVEEGDSGSLVAGLDLSLGGAGRWRPIGFVFAETMSEGGLAIASPLAGALAELSAQIGSPIAEILTKG